MQQLDKIELVGKEIAVFLNEPLQMVCQLVNPWQGTRFVVCGTSGSGKTRAIGYANQLLSEHEQVSESHDILQVRDASVAIQIMQNPNLAYERSLHIAFNVCYRDVGKCLESKGIKVFWLDQGSSKRRSIGTA